MFAPDINFIYSDDMGDIEIEGVEVEVVAASLAGSKFIVDKIGPAAVSFKITDAEIPKVTKAAHEAGLKMGVSIDGSGILVELVHVEEVKEEFALVFAGPSKWL